MRNDLKTMKAYKTPADDIINLANNENHYSDWNNLLNDELKKHIDNIPFFSYGEAIHSNLVTGYANYVNLKPEQILAGPGSDGLVALLFNALTTKTIISLEQDFFRYNEFAKILYRDNIQVKNSEDCYEEIIEIANNKDVELIILSNPNNPLGTIHPHKKLVKILDNTNCYVVIDEAYIEFYGTSVVDLIDSYDKLIVLRTMSKAWGLAGLRVGYVLTNADLVHYLYCVQGPFSLSPLNAAIAASVLNNQNVMNEMVTNTIDERIKFMEYLNEYKINKIYESHTNFVYFDVENAMEIKNKLIEDKFAIGFFAPSALRVSIGTPVQMELFKEKLSKYLTKK